MSSGSSSSTAPFSCWQLVGWQLVCWQSIRRKRTAVAVVGNCQAVCWLVRPAVPGKLFPIRASAERNAVGSDVRSDVEQGIAAK